MTISYTSLLGLAQPVTGTETGQWGTVVNDEITALLEDAVANSASISVTAGNVTLSTTNGSSNQARMATLIITGTPGTTRNVVAPSQAKIYVVINQSDGAVVIKGAATSGVTIGAGQTAQVAWNGSDFVEIGNYVHGNFVVNGNLSVNGDSTLGNAGADTTTINGQVIAANSNISKTTTLSASAPALAWIKGATYTDTGTAGGTTQALAPFTVFSAPTLSTSNIVTYTNAATVYVAGAPAAAGSATITNPYALYVAAGDAYFGASVALNAGTANGVPYLSSPGKVLTTGSALTWNTNVLAATGSNTGYSLEFDCTTLPLVIRADDNTGASYASIAFSLGNGSIFSEVMRLTSTGLKASIAGTNADPVFSYTSDTNTGIFFPAADKLGFVAGGGSDQMVLTTTGLGIGTNNPAYKLHVVNDTAATNTAVDVLALTQSSTGTADSGLGAGILFNSERPTGGAIIKRGAIYGVAGTDPDDDGALAFYTLSDTGPSGFTEKMRLDSSGNLGIGTNNPAYKLDVNGTGSIISATRSDTNRADIIVTNSGGTVSFGINNSTGSWLTNGLPYYGYILGPSNASYGLQFGVGASNTAAVTIDPSGNLGLGVTPSAWNADYKVEQIGSTSSFYGRVASAQTGIGENFYRDAGGTFRYISSSQVSRLELDSGAFYWYTAGSGTAGDPITFIQAMTLLANGNLGIGETNPTQKLTVSGTGTVSSRTIATDATGDASFFVANNDTKLAGPLVYGSTKTAYGALGSNETAFYSNVSTTLMADGASQVIKFAAGGNTERARITSGGYFKASNSGTYNNSTGSFHELYQNSASEPAVVITTPDASYTGNSTFIEVARNTTNNSFYALSYYNTGAAAFKFRVADSGNVTNTNGTYGTISDAKMKTDIVDAGSQWSDIKALRFRKFKMKDDPSGLVQLGVVAQEVEQTSPGLVDEHADKDAEGNDLGTTTKSVKTSVLLMKAAVALQEAMARIEKLEAEVAALKGA